MKKNRIRKYYLVPFGLALRVYEERAFREFQVWLLLNHWTNGHLQLTPAVIGRLAVHLKTSSRTIERAIDRLRCKNWLGYNPNNGLTHVRGFDTLRIVERLPGRLAVWFDIGKMADVEGFTTACAFGWFIRAQKVRAWRERLGGYEKGVPIQPRQPAALPKFFPVALSLIERRFGVSRSTVCRGRKAASRAGFLLIQKKKPEPLNIDSPRAYLKGFPEMKDRLFCKNGIWFLRQTDEAQTNLNYKRRFRLE